MNTENEDEMRVKYYVKTHYDNSPALRGRVRRTGLIKCDAIIEALFPDAIITKGQFERSEAIKKKP